MILGPPWSDPPTLWALDGIVFRYVEAPTVLQVVNPLVSERREAGLWMTLAMTHRTDAVLLMERLLDPDLPQVKFDQLDDIADALVRELLGMERWVGAELWRRVLSMWQQIDGRLSAQGVDIMDMHPARASNAALGVFRELFGQDIEGWKKWKESLERKPTGVWRREQRRRLAEQTTATTAAATSSTMQAFGLLGGEFGDPLQDGDSLVIGG